MKSTAAHRITHNQRGFTLVELIVVLVTLGVLGTFSVPALTGYIDKSKEKQAVSETQACVSEVTRLAAEQYAQWQQQTVAAELSNSSETPSITITGGWANAIVDKAPTVSGDVALTEGAGQYLLHVEQLPTFPSGVGAPMTLTYDIPSTIGLTGTIGNFVCNRNGQILYLVYTSKDNIQVVYTASGSVSQVDTGSDVAKVPTPTPSVVPDPPAPEPSDSDTLAVIFVKSDSFTKKAISGALLQLTNANGTVVDTWTSSETETKSINLPEGTYTLTEVQEPSKYNKAFPITFTVNKNKNGSLSLKAADDAYKTNISSSSATVTMYDSPMTTSVTFWAVDEDGNKLSGVPLQLTSGSFKNLEDSDTQWVSSDTTGHTLSLSQIPDSYTFRVNADYKYKIGKEFHSFNYTDFPYYIPNKVVIKMNADGTMEIIDHTDDNRITAKCKIENGNIYLTCFTKRYRLNLVNIYKKDASGEPLANAKFTVTDTKDNSLVKEVTSSGEVKTIFADVKDDVYLKADHVYRLRETEAPDGYQTVADLYFKLAPKSSFSEAQSETFTLLTSSSPDGTFTAAERNMITLVDLSDDGFKIIAKPDNDSTTISFKSDRWPGDTLHNNSSTGNDWYFKDENGKDTSSMTVKEGSIYYHEVNGKKEYYFCNHSETFTHYHESYPSSNNGTTFWYDPTEKGYCAKRISSSSTLLTAYSPNVNMNTQKIEGNLYSGDLFLYNGELYMYCGGGGKDTWQNFPTDNNENWKKIDPSYYTISPYTKGSDPVGEVNGKYPELKS